MFGGRELINNAFAVCSDSTPCTIFQIDAQLIELAWGAIAVFCTGWGEVHDFIVISGYGGGQAVRCLIGLHQRLYVLIRTVTKESASVAC